MIRGEDGGEEKVLTTASDTSYISLDSEDSEKKQSFRFDSEFSDIFDFSMISVI